MLKKVNEAKRQLAKYDEEKVDYVRQCVDDVNHDISAMHLNDLNDDAISVNISGIKTDYLIEAIEDDLMTGEESNEIYNLLDIIGLEAASAYS